VPFYRSKGSVYNVWFTGMSTPYFRTKLTPEGSHAACIIRLNYPKRHDEVLALLRLPHGAVVMKAMRIPIHALMHVLDPDLEGGVTP
jgi:hypothetical protein